MKMNKINDFTPVRFNTKGIIMAKKSIFRRFKLKCIGKKEFFYLYSNVISFFQWDFPDCHTDHIDI